MIELRPPWDVLRSVGDDQKDGQTLDPASQYIERFLTGGVDPMDVLEHHQDRLTTGQCLHMVGQYFERLLLPLLRREVEWRITLARE